VKRQPETQLEQVIAESTRLAEPTIKQYRIAVRSFVHFAGMDPSQWTPSAAVAWSQQLRVRPKSKNVYIAGLRYASRRWAALHDGRDFAGALETVLVPAEKHSRSPKPLGEEQLDAMLGTCARADSPLDLRDRAILAIAIATGFRRASIAGIEFDDLDHRNRSIVVVQKGNRVHRVRVGAQCWARITAWIAWLRRHHVGSGRVFRGLRRKLDAELGWHVGKALDGEAVYRIVKRRARAAGIRERVCAHTFRHSLAALLRQRGVPEEQIAKRLGHANAATTALYGQHEVLHDVLDDRLPS
jgi:integrase